MTGTDGIMQDQKDSLNYARPAGQMGFYRPRGQKIIDKIYMADGIT
jgi:hypothetical protein